MMMTCRFQSLLFTGVALMVGCAHYVNIPAQPGDLAGHNPNSGVVRQVLSEAIKSVVQERNVEAPFSILLPENTSAKTYSAVASNTSKQAVWPGNRTRKDLPLLEVKQILIRRQEARVDLVCRPNKNESDAPGQLVTVDLMWHPLQGWLTQRVRTWQLPLEKALHAARIELE